MEKKILHPFIIGLFVFIQIGFSACSSNEVPEEPIIDDEKKTLTVDTAIITFTREESSIDIIVSTNVDMWVMSSSGTSWVTLSKTSGFSGNTKVTISATENISIAERSSVITVNANGVDAIKIYISQEGVPSENGIYPDYNTNPIPEDQTGMTNSASEIAAKISLGWNLGNSLEAIGGETAWGNPQTTKALIDLVKQSGFNAVRIPCSWNQYLEDSDNAKLSADWLNRVQEVIQYCIDNEMYILLNIHWDGGWLENNVTENNKEQNNAKQKAFWEQIAIHLRDFDEHLLFASTNEPNVEDATQMEVLNSYHQTFINAVRATGGKNVYRTLVVQGPSTDVEKTNTLMTTLPTDPTADRLMAEVHYYTPWQFCGLEEDANWGTMFYYWGQDYHSTTDTERNATWGEENTMQDLFSLMKSQFVDQGIPVVLGEFGVTRRSNLTGDALELHLASRAYFLKYVVQQSKENGLLPFYWDNGNIGLYGSGIFDRITTTVSDQQALQGLLDGLNP